MNAKPTAMIISDLHLRDDQPICRTDNFWETQIQKLKWINNEWVRQGYPPILCAGDIFHKAKPSPLLLSMAIQHLPASDRSHDNYYLHTIPGNHDLPNHNMKLLKHSGLYVLQIAGNVWVAGKEFSINNDTIRVRPFPFGTAPEVAKKHNDKRPCVALAHFYTYKGKKPWADCKSPPCSKILDMFKGYDLVITGDNHQSFTYQNKRGQLLINPGCMSRQNLSEQDYQPSVYLWYADNNRVERKRISIDDDVFSEDHIKGQREYKARENAFVESLSDNYIIDMSFEENLKRFIKNNPDIEDVIINRVWRAVQGE